MLEHAGAANPRRCAQGPFRDSPRHTPAAPPRRARRRPDAPACGIGAAVGVPAARLRRGLRLHPLPNPDVYWFELMLRQHELCWLTREAARRSRASCCSETGPRTGYPLPAEQDVAGPARTRTSAPRAARRPTSSTWRRRRPIQGPRRGTPGCAWRCRSCCNVIVYPVTLAESPPPRADAGSGRRAFLLHERRGAAARRGRSAGRAGRAARHLPTWLTKWRNQRHWNDQLRDLGLYARRAARAWAEAVSVDLQLADAGLPTPTPKRAATANDCATAEKGYQADRDWKKWNILAYLEDPQTHPWDPHPCCPLADRPRAGRQV